MQLLLLGMAAALFLHDDLLLPATPAAAASTGGWFSELLRNPAFCLPALASLKLIVLIAFARQCHHTFKSLGTPQGHVALRRLDRCLTALPGVLLALFALDVSLGWLTLVRAGVGDLVVVDEALVMLPTLLIVLACWWLHHPIDRRLREATIMRRADQGLPVYPLMSRGRYVFNQARHQLGILLVPLLILMAWSESIQHFADQGRISYTAALWLTPLGAGAMFVLSPPLLTRVFDTVPLPPGSIRDALQEVCDTHGIRVADLRLWRTGGHVINAAVMGLVPRLRYVLMTDGLLDQLHRPHVEAVMAHELGHVKHRHLIWLVLFAGLLLGGCFSLADTVVARTTDAVWMQTACVIAALLLWAWAFGWCSRRIERQADVFAAKHMSRAQGSGVRDLERQSTVTRNPDPRNPDPRNPDPRNPDPRSPTPDPRSPTPDPRTPTFTPDGISHVVAALGRVAELNHLRPSRPSWRHGSIAQRQDYLLTLIDRPVHRASVDRVMHRLQAASIAAVVTLIAISFWN